MEIYNEDALDTISELRQEIKNTNYKIELAAEFGKDLLDKNSDLERQLSEIRSENELLKQDRYSLQLDLETKSQSLNIQNSEVEIQREQYDNLVKKFDTLQKEKVRLKQKLNNFEKEKVDFEKAEEDAHRENYALKKKIDLLEQQIQGYQQKAEATINLGVIDDFNEDDNINVYRERNKQLQEVVADIQCESESLKLTEIRLNDLVKELEEGIHDRDKEIASYSVEVQKAKNVVTELQGEIEILKLEQVDVNRRGNSVFSELDDRRKLVEKEYKLLQKKYENMKVEYINNKREITNCKGQMAILLSMTSRNFQDTYISKLEDQLGDAKREIESLTAQLSKTTKNLQDTRVEQNFKGDNNSEYEYLRVLCEQSEKRVKELENELITARMKNMSDNDELVKIRQQLYQLQISFDEEKLENMKLRQKIRELIPLSDSEVASIKSDANFIKNNEDNETSFDRRSIVSGEVVLSEKGIRCVKTLNRPASNSRLPFKSNEHILKELQVKSKEEKSKISGPHKDAKYNQQTEFCLRSRKQHTRKPPECAQQ